jgi:UDP-glucuronate 4-epimerase
MHALVTGAAGFIGSHLAEALLADGHRVTAVDGFTDYYDIAVKARNVAAIASHPEAELIEADLLDLDLPALLAPVDVVFHQAGQPGVRLSWGDSFAVYDRLNVLVTQQLLEAARTTHLDRFVYASSSSVYGEAERYPTVETDLPQPRSPYGVTKLAGEHLCALYATQWQVPTVALRYFTVYGPRQRPDMAFHRLTRAALTGERFPLYGTGDQVRDFTYVADIVQANLLAAAADLEPGVVMNIAGGGESRLGDLIDLAGELAGRPVNVEALPEAAGDIMRTGGDTTRAVSLLGWIPTTDVETGLKAELEWMRDQIA